MKKTIIIILTLIILCSFSVSADMFPYNLFSGGVTLNGAGAPVGYVLTATMGGTAAGSATITTEGSYTIAVTKQSGVTTDTITFTLTGADSSSTTTYKTSQENGAPVWLDFAFTSTTTAAAGDGTAGGGGISSSTGADVTVPIKITNPREIAEILEWVTATDLGLTSLSADDVVIYLLSTETEEAVVSSAQVDNMIGMVAEEAQDELLNIKQVLESEGVQVTISKDLNVYKIQSKENNNVVERSKISLTVTAVSDVKDVKVVEIIPKSVARHVSHLIFLGEQPSVLQADPVVEWTIPFMNQGLSKTFEYVVKKKLDTFQGETIAAGTFTEEIPEPVIPPTKPAYGWIIAIAIIVLGLGWYFSRRKR